ncbi:Rieske (2Fe-2S) protein [Streptomyces kunmingensis]|uniref:Rieske (2Fe-2S) protein n=1 Tax=Streptomyces kunmingensis TaxID=68225 RepID=A0ABU6C7C7_9ACTN|nr:DUF5914 domain-containing protein [Streptomyces kunmingensis]MEB3960607.1 Rieske (2Fe-2S) protein [Streptomyces kunmingensis]
MNKRPRTPRFPLTLRRNPQAWERQEPTWRAARPSVIETALKRSQARPSGNWYVVGAADEVPRRAPLGRTVAGREIVVWRDAHGDLAAGPGACPHLGAPLKDSPVRCGTLVCHWHGMALGAEGKEGWRTLPVHDDGVLMWVRLDGAGGEEPLGRPVIPPRPDPARSVHAVYTGAGRCEPEDVVANRLDPWHGAWFHPYSFVDLRVVDSPPGDAGGTDADPDRFVVEVSFKLTSRLVVPVRAVFTAPEPRTVVMHITDGEGRDSVVETHATPLTPAGHPAPRTAVVEAVIATSERPGFTVARHASFALRPLMRAAAGRLWRDDLAYAERRWTLRSRRSPEY